MNAEERRIWLEDRKLGIGGSDAAVALGLSKWKTPLELYEEKAGVIEVDPNFDNEPMYWGRMLEGAVRQRYCDDNEVEVVVPNESIVSKAYPFMRATPDGIAGDRMIEIKTARFADGWGEEGTDEIPQAYLIQVQHNMIVCDLEICDVPVLISGQDYREYIVPADRELQEMIIEAEHKFWALVQAKTPPEPVSLADMQHAYATSKDAIVQASHEVVEALAGLVSLKKDIKNNEIEEADFKAIIMGAMGDADKLMHGEKLLATWKSAKPRKGFDAYGLKKDDPEMHAKYVKEGNPSRRFLVK